MIINHPPTLQTPLYFLAYQWILQIKIHIISNPIYNKKSEDAFEGRFTAKQPNKNLLLWDFLHPLLPGLTVPFTEKWIKRKFGLDTHLKRCSLNHATHRDMIMLCNDVFWGYVIQKQENMLDTGPKRCIISICAHKTSCTESRNLPEVNWCKVGRKKWSSTV